MEEKIRQKVVVIGHGYTSRLGVIRALGSVGYEVIDIVMVVNKRKGKPDYTPPIDSYSKYVSAIYYCLPDKDQLISLLLAKCVDDSQKVVLFPDSDFSAAAIDLNQEKLEKHFLFPHIMHTPGSVVEWMNKIKQKETAARLGLNVAHGTIINVENGVYELPSSIDYPCFPKPVMSLVGAKTGLGCCESEHQLRNALDKLIKRSPTISVLVEDYLDIDDEFALLGVSDGQSVHIPGIIHISSLAKGGHFGVAKKGEILPVDGYESLLEGFKAFVLQTRFVGVFDIDFFKSEGRFYFCEMNFRYGGSGYAYTKMNVNMPDLFVRTVTREMLPDSMPRVNNRAVFVNERMCLDDWYKGLISTSSFVSLFRHNDISFISDPDDKIPEKRFRFFAIKEIVKRIAKRNPGKNCD